ncbi:protein-glutamine glutaminase family protein [Bdellovibrio sp. HCB-110]|uniref:protein-glutamine glutaminase family protein n=1 Tax=Bdellovibrio sp. HCB-110 TaxID=3391182 RepID=UPI0039B6B14E
MKFLFALLLSLGLSATALAKGLSSHRSPDENYETARNRHFFFQTFNFPFPDSPKADTTTRYVSAERAKKPLKSLDIKEIPDVGSYSDLENEFFYVRDTRFLTTQDRNFPRRLTWMYPDDGCYARAEIAKYELENHHFPAPKKVFVFGNLSAPSSNSPTGSVQWWYHVAVTYRVGPEVYVFDPSLEPQRPLKLAEWNKLVGGENTHVQYSVCDHETYDPSGDCYHPTPLSRDEAYYEQKSFLQYEWDRIVELKRNPEQELGNNPPWLK